MRPRKGGAVQVGTCALVPACAPHLRRSPFTGLRDPCRKNATRRGMAASPPRHYAFLPSPRIAAQGVFPAAAAGLLRPKTPQTKTKQKRSAMTLTQIQKMRRQSGFTLVELLIVMLIVGILSIAMLPMYKKYMTKAKYTAEGLPILATIKTQIDLAIYDLSYAPGLADTVYTWTRDASTGEFAPAYHSIGTAYPEDADIQAFTADPTKTDIENWHLRRLVKESELQGKLIRPNHVFYACINPGMPANIDPTGSATMAGDYGYAIGVFGDGNGLPQNSGVATMEVHMSAPEVGDSEVSGTRTTGVTVLGTWENFDGSGINPIHTEGQIRFASSGAADPKSCCGIWDQNTMSGVNDTGKTLDDVQTAVNQLINDLECGKWTFPKYK